MCLNGWSLAVPGWQRWGWRFAPARQLTGQFMPINRLLQSAAFDAEQTRQIISAYQGALSRLGLVDRIDPVTELVAQTTELVAQTIIDCAAAGEIDCDKLRDCAVATITSH